MNQTLSFYPSTDEALNFSNLPEEVFDICECYFQDVELLCDYDDSIYKFEESKLEFEVKNFLEKIYLKIQKFLSKK